MSPLTFKVRGDKEVSDYLKGLPRIYRGKIAQWVAEYLLGDDRHGLRHYRAYRYVSRRRAYGRTFESQAQAAYVMSRIRRGEITPGVPRRTDKLKNAWRILGTGVKVTLENATPYAPHVVGDDDQARQPALAGWRTMLQTIEDNIDGAIRYAEQQLEKLFRQQR